MIPKLIEVELFNMCFERKLRPNKMEGEDVVFCWLFRFQDGRFNISDFTLTNFVKFIVMWSLPLKVASGPMVCRD